MSKIGKIAALGLIAAALGLHPIAAMAASAPAVADAQKMSEEAKGAGTHIYYTSRQSAQDVMSAYRSTLEADGWTIDSMGGGGSAWGGNAGLTASKGAEYLVMSIGGETGATNIDLCVWPSKPADDNC